MALHYPSALLSVLEAERTLDLFFDGLRKHYVKCYANGQIEDWRKLAHQLIDYQCDLPATAKPLRKRPTNG